MGPAPCFPALSLANFLRFWSRLYFKSSIRSACFLSHPRRGSSTGPDAVSPGPSPASLTAIKRAVVAPVSLSRRSHSSSVVAKGFSAVALLALYEAPFAYSGSSSDWRPLSPLTFSVTSWRTSLVWGLPLLEVIACGGSCSWGLCSLDVPAPGHPCPDLALTWNASEELPLLFERVSPAALAAHSTFVSQPLSLYISSAQKLPLIAGLSCVAPCPLSMSSCATPECWGHHKPEVSWGLEERAGGWRT